MTWYRVALADGYTQAPLVHSPWLRDEQLPEPCTGPGSPTMAT